MDDGRTTYIIRSTWPNPSMALGPKHECLKADDNVEDVVADANPEPDQLQGHLIIEKY